MLPAPVTLLEAALWEVHARLDEARASGVGVSAVDDEAKALLASYLAAGPEHVTAVRAFLRRLDAENAHLQTERARLVLAIEVAEGDRRRFRAHVLNALRASGGNVVHALAGQLYLTRSRRTVEVRDVGRLPERFVHVLPEQRRVRERDLYAALAAGEAVPGALLVEGETRLGIR